MEQMLQVQVPKNIETLLLPDPSLLMFYENYENRIIWLDTEVDENWLEYAKKIISWNAEDKGKPIEERKPIKLFFFSPVLSSIITALTPMRSNVRTLYTKCSVNPPVSPSRMIGLVVTSIMSSIVRKRDVISTNSISGFPLSVLSQREDTHMPSN